MVRVVACEEFGVGEGELAAAGEEEAEGEVRIEVGGVGGDGATVGGLGGGDLGRGFGEGVLREGEVVEEVRVVGRFFGEGGQEFEGGGVVALVEGLIGLSEEGVLFLLLWLSGVGGAGGELGVDRLCGGEKTDEYERCPDKGTKCTPRRGGDFIVCCLRHRGTPPSSYDCKFKQGTSDLEFVSAIKCGSPTRIGRA